MEVIVKNAAVVRILEEIADAFRTLRPPSYRAFLAIVDEESKALKRPNAMSTDGHMLNFCKLPADLYTFVKQQMRKRCGIDDFFRDAKNYYLLTKVWSDARIRRTPTHLLLTKELCIDQPPRPQKGSQSS